MRTFGLDVHKTFIEVALHEDGAVKRVGRVAIKDLATFAASLSPTDHVVPAHRQTARSALRQPSSRAARPRL